jgi:molybdate-binding protein
MSAVPAYRDIAESLLRRVADGDLAPGAALPSVRTAAAEHEAAPATVGRAYAELARLGVLELAPRRAARVAGDASVHAHRALHGTQVLRLAGSDDPLLDRIAGGSERVGAPGSFGGLTALWQGRADAATLHLRHRDGDYNAPFAAGVLEGRRPVLVHLWRREQGILLPSGNPHAIEGVADLVRHPVALRGPGTGTRVLLERLLREAGADPAALHGPQIATHLEAAMAVASGLADAAVGLRAAADAVGLDFMPLAWEPYELALSEDALGAAGDLLGALGAAPAMAGFDLAGAGSIRRV